MAEDEYTKSLLHFDGADASVTFTDESSKAWNVDGSAQLTTGEKKFGTAGGVFAGDGGIYTPTHADFVFADGDFSIDFWVRITTSSGDMCLCAKFLNGYNYAPFAIFKLNGEFILKFYSSSNGSSWNLCNGVTIGTLTTGVWAHVAICRSGTNVYCFLNGVLGSTTDVGAATVLANAEAVRIGSDGTYYHSTSNVDEMRFSKGIARWTENFTPSDVPYEWEQGITLPLLQLEI